MLSNINRKYIWVFLLLLFTGVLLWMGIHYVPEGKARFTLKDDMAALNRSEAMVWDHSGVRASFTIDPKIGDKEDRFQVVAYAYKEGNLVFSREMSYLQNTLRDNATTIQLYETKGKGFKLEGLGAGMGTATEYFLEDLKEFNGFWLDLNDRVKMKKGEDEKVIALYTIGTQFRKIDSEMTLKDVEIFKENAMTLVFTIKAEEK